VPAAVSFSKNSVDASNASGVQNNWPQAGTVNMTCNWWGNASGLGGAGSSTITGPGPTALITIPGLNSGTDTQPATTGFQTNEVCPPVILPVNITMVSATVVQGNVKVSWNSATEAGLKYYEVEHSNNGREFVKLGRVTARNVNGASYDFIHQQPGTGNHYYRLRSEDADGKNTTSQIVKISLGEIKPGIVIYPNVVNTSNRITLQLNALNSGKYQIKLTDMAGRVLMAQLLEHHGNASAQTITLPASLSAGKYLLHIIGNEKSFTESLMKF
jgi:hypothetical protein